MNRLSKVSLALAAAVAAGPAAASDMFLDLTPFGGNVYDANTTVGIEDADAVTGIFNEFGFSQILATSIYDYSDGSVFGSFFDTNVVGDIATPNTLTYVGVPDSGTSLDGSTTVSLVLPNCTPQCDLDALSPLVPPLGSDNEGFLDTWELVVEYTFFGTLTAGGPVYNSGTVDVFFKDNYLVDGDQSALAISGSLTGSTVNLANLDLFFDVTFAVDGFFWIDDGSGTFRDAHDVIAAGGTPTLTLDTNVNPPIPTGDELLLVVDAGGNPNVIRQSTLDGSITAAIPEPSTLALVGLAMFGVGAYSRRRRG